MLQSKQMLTFTHNWGGAKEFYISAGPWNGVTFETVSKRFKIPYQSVRRRASKERWRLIREWKSIEPELESVDEYIYYYK
jgi:hypothetical protein